MFEIIKNYDTPKKTIISGSGNTGYVKKNLLYKKHKLELHLNVNMIS